MKPFRSVLTLIFAALSASLAFAEPEAQFRPSFSSRPRPSGFSSGPPLQAGPANSGCALIIPGSGFSSRESCITFDDVNSAFLQARDRVGLRPPRGECEEECVHDLATVVIEATRTLAAQYKLDADAIANGLPLIDTSKTVIYDYCPEFLRTPQCKVERYRQTNGHCNNLDNAFWGCGRHGHHRWMPADFADGISAPRASVTGAPLPSARAVSSAVHEDLGFHDHAVTLLLVAWGQFIDHDFTLTAETRDPKTRKAPKCCEGSNVHPNCLPIEIPPRDYFFKDHNQRCMNFVRSPNGLNKNCRLGARDSFNLISSYIDAGTVYGASEKATRELRSFEGGRLKMLPVFDEFGMKDLLPLKLEEPDEGCIRPSEDVYCFLAGDGRVNEQTVLGMIHTVMAREHNRMADELSRINPHWNDETIFQEVRHIMGAMHQHITYNEFLPMVLGKEIMQQYDLILVKQGYYNGYDPSINPSVSNVFSTAAFRMGHTLLPSTIERWSKTHRYIGSQRLSEMLQQPYDLFKGGWADNYIMGLVNQVAQAYDDSITQEVTNHLFQEPGKKFGLDLAALNMQRGREHGIPSYNRWREFCGSKPFRHWDEMLGLFPNKTVSAYRNVYSSPEDIDLWSAGVSEKSLPGSLVGPTFACLIGKQMSNLRHGDRYWYENGGWPSSFTVEQLAEIRKVKLSRVLCDNSDELVDMQVYAMVLPDHEINPRLACRGGVLPRMDLTKWRDASFHSSPSGFGSFKK